MNQYTRDFPVESELASAVEGSEFETLVQGRRRDEHLRLAILTALHWDLAVPRNRVEVRVKNGWVTLSGKVDRPYEKTCALADARNCPGVLGVTSEIACDGF